MSAFLCPIQTLFCTSHAKDLVAGAILTHRGQQWNLLEVSKMKPFQIGRDGFPRLVLTLHKVGGMKISVSAYGTSDFDARGGMRFRFSDQN